jgi:organic radical activating enzyme
MKVNAIYSTFSGEVNPFGIGAPTIFLRLQGCPIRCYARTLGVLCDTPEALKKSKDSTDMDKIFKQLEDERSDTGINFITLSGGDPLWNDEETLKELFIGMLDRGFRVTVETSGTISWLPYMFEGVYMILDYKLKSAGISNGTDLFFDLEHLRALRKEDYIKFVVHDLEDYTQFKFATEHLLDNTDAKIAVGSYWGGDLDTFALFELLKNDAMLGKVTLNMQAHKMAISSNYDKEIPQKI